MQIIDRFGDFITGDEPMILHGCNAQGEMGSGAAKAVRTAFPCAYIAYRTAYLTQGLKLGEVIWAIDSGHGKIIANGITQEHYGAGDRRYVSYDAIRDVLRAVDAVVERTQRPSADDGIDIAGMTPIKEVAMPMIGAGLGGGDWTQIASIIEEESRHFSPVVYRLR